jgi:hypothetical protein
MQKQIQTDAIDAWHGFDRLASVFTFKHKHRVDEIVDTECMLAHQTAAKVCSAQTAGTVSWKGCCHGVDVISS